MWQCELSLSLNRFVREWIVHLNEAKLHKNNQTNRKNQLNYREGGEMHKVFGKYECGHIPLCIRAIGMLNDWLTVELTIANMKLDGISKQADWRECIQMPGEQSWTIAVISRHLGFQNWRSAKFNFFCITHTLVYCREINLENNFRLGFSVTTYLTEVYFVTNLMSQATYDQYRISIAYRAYTYMRAISMRHIMCRTNYPICIRSKLIRK